MTVPGDHIEKLVRRGAVSVHPEDPVGTIAKTLYREEVGVVLVREADGAVRGIVSERDVIRALADDEVSTEDQRAVDLMSFDVESVRPHETVEEAARTMVRGGIRHLAVMHEEQPIGVVSMRDVLETYLQS